jgi:hypothetical protein
MVALSGRDEAADAPPFPIIGRKFGFNYDSIVFVLMQPHAKMNFGLSRPEANDGAAYITTFAEIVCSIARRGAC